METKTIINQLRMKMGMSQEEVAEKVFVTRQAVSRWENGDTVPNTDTLKLLSELFGVSVDELLGLTGNSVCQCCGMPLNAAVVSSEKDGALNTDYCKWCYSDGKFAYTDIDKLIDFCAEHMASAEHPETEVRAYLSDMLPKLKYWRQRAEKS
ncbi:DNA-binding transcriptional regulator, XRE-family HTH domain [Ruminococcus sp. YRD2003]|uniref:zinc ribbon domain-containing protein n=1 Tax=Ruminococcus sp. YRD2003 TaxID=1452313 RepID=UPI0008BE174E|nr:DNA-binding transcriptional regulator, XRE-family HTH domain [Ruminococcus flavefaciens]